MIVLVSVFRLCTTVLLQDRIDGETTDQGPAREPTQTLITTF